MTEEERHEFLRQSIESHDRQIGELTDKFDRLEGLIESAEQLNAARSAANGAAHDWFEAEHKRLLTAQILMSGAMQKMADGMISLELKMAETTDKLNALIVTVDGVIPKRGTA
jgi:septal ring factor EnvC (AmiA/AmiB activator)